MPRYAPQSLPMGGSRPQTDHIAEDMVQQNPANETAVSPAVSLGQHIRRERGMEGVRGYAVALREYLPSQEYQELCRSLGVPADLQPSVQHHQQQVQQAQPAPEPPPAQNGNNMLQMLQMLMALQGGSMGGGFNPLAQLMQGGMPNMQGGMPNMQGGGQNGLNPMMLAQLLGAMQPK